MPFRGSILATYLLQLCRFCSSHLMVSKMIPQYMQFKWVLFKTILEKKVSWYCSA